MQKRASLIPDAIALFVICGAFLLILAPFANQIGLGDEWLFIYNATLIPKGFLPYRDFFFSHPPLHLIIIYIVHLFAGTFLPAFRIAPIIITMLSGLIVYRTVRRSASILPSFLACVLFLFSVRILAHAIHFTGWNAMLFFLLLSFDQFLSRRMISSGVALGASLLCNPLGGMGVVPIIATLIFKKDKQSLLHFLYGLMGIVLPFVLFFFLISGNAFFEQFILYQLKKPTRPEGRLSSMIMFGWEMMRQWPLMLLTISSLPLLLWNNAISQGKKRVLKLALSFFGTALVCLTLIGLPYHYYFIIVVPFAAIAAGISIAWIINRYHTSSGWEKWLIGILGLITTLLVVHASARPILRAGLSRSLPNHNYTVTYAIAETIDQILPPDSPIFGNFAVAPVIALMTGRRISAMEGDTSAVRFTSGVNDFPSFLQRLEADPPGGIILMQNGSISSYAPFINYLEEHYVLSHTFFYKKGPIARLWIRDYLFPENYLP